MSPYPQIATLKLQLNQWYTEAEDHITAKMTAEQQTQDYLEYLEKNL